MSSTRAFTQDEHDQSQSPLGELPAEITVKILRNLLRAEDGIVRSLREMRVRDADLTEEQYRDRVPGTAQILRACQRLHREGIQVLYGMQSLGISIFDPDMDVPSCHILNVSSEIPQGRSDNDLHLMLDMLECTEIVSPQKLSRLLDNSEPIMHNFQKVMIKVNSTRVDATEVFIFCRALRAYLTDKHVTVRIADTSQPEFEELDIFIAAFNILKCDFVRFEENVWTEHFTTSLDKTYRYVELSDDLYGIWYNMMSNFVLQLPEYEGFENHYSGDMRNMLLNVLRHDEAGFSNAQNDLMRKAKKWLHETVHGRTATL